MTPDDLEKLLEQLPLWRSAADFPQRFARLERRIEELEAQSGTIKSPPNIPEGKDCPICGSLLKVTSERPHVDFGFAGRKTHSMECTQCGATTERDFNPGKGYR